MRWLLILALLLLPHQGEAKPFGGGASLDGCPVGTPSPIGSIIHPVGTGQVSCVLVDGVGQTWQFREAVAYRNGSPTGIFDISGFTAIQIGTGSVASNEADNGVTFWVHYNTSCSCYVPSVIDGLNGLAPDPFKDVTTGISGPDLTLVGAVGTGDTLTIGALPSNGTGSQKIWYTTTPIQVSNLTINLAAGAVIGVNATFNNAILTQANGANGTTIIGAGPATAVLGGSEIAYLHDPNSGAFRCINFGNDNNWSISGVYIHDCDMGLISTLQSGATGAISNALFEHNGAGGSFTAGTHNIYISIPNGGMSPSSTGAFTVNNVRTYCANGTSGGGPGFMFKARWPQGTITNFIAAEPSQHGYLDCSESASVDLSCGGVYVIGGTGAGSGAVIEEGPNAWGHSKGDGVIRYGRENANTQNCPSNGTGWPTSSLTVQNCWIINDTGDATVTAVILGPFTPNPSVVVKNCKLVGLAGLGTGVTDGGGNTFFATRTAAGLAPYPALPSPP